MTAKMTNIEKERMKTHSRQIQDKFKTKKEGTIKDGFDGKRSFQETLTQKENSQ